MSAGTGEGLTGCSTALGGVFITAIGISLLVADYWTKTPVLTVPGISTLLAGVFGIVVRVWFTDTPIATPKAVANLTARQDQLELQAKTYTPQSQPK